MKMVKTQLNTLILLLLFVLFSNFTGCLKEEPSMIDGLPGTVKDYTGLDGCGFIIELDNGDKLEPAEIVDTGFIFYDGQRVLVTYTELGGWGSYCMVGKIVRIETIQEIGCNEISTYSNSLPNDGFVVNDLTINGDCLELNVSYGGGCKPHYFQLVVLPTMKSKPLGPLNVLALCHEANDDLCEAWITKDISFNLRQLQNTGIHSVTFMLRLNFEGSDYSKELTYTY